LPADPNLGVIGYEVIPYALPFQERYVTARGDLSRREMVLVRAHTKDGIIGLGEAVPLSLRGGRSLEEVVSELRRFAIEFGDATESEQRSFFLEAGELSPPSRCAISTAWDDLLGKRQEVPVWKLHGAEEASPVQCNATLSVGDPDEVADAGRRWAADGFRTFKLKLGLTNDVEQVEAVRAAVGPEAKLRVDANGVWGPAEAVSKLEQMSDFDIELVEQPCATLEELAQVRAAVDTPIVADESVTSWSQAQQARELQACDFATLKLSKVGGSVDAKAIAGEIPSYLSSALDGPVGIAAAAHTAQALHLGDDRDPGLAHGLATQRLFSETIASRECELRDGFLHLPEGPGLGVEIDGAALERHKL
jgi:L-alanine-DL-glutamate epimerase-like enolase superfamily enzyme